jgi:hypothetical protein
MTEPRRRGRPRSTGVRECGRCHHLVPKIRTHWPEGPICGPCFTTAARTYGCCAFCGAQRLLPGRSPTGHDICRDCAGITTNLGCDNCGREAERLRGGHCARCVLTGDLERILKPHAPLDMRIKRLITELAAVPRPESIITWMRNPVTADLLAKIGTRELQLTHDAFDALPASRSREHLREMLVHHRMMPSRGDRQLVRFEAWLDRRLQTLQPTPAIHTPIEQFARWHHLHRLRENTDPTRNMDYATRCAQQEITEATKFLRWLLDEHNTTINDLRQDQLDAYLCEGTTTRTAIRNFIQWRARTGIAAPLKTRYRTARTTPLTPTRQRLELIKTVAEADHVVLSTRIAALILLLYGIPVRKICELTPRRRHGNARTDNHQDRKAPRTHTRSPTPAVPPTPRRPRKPPNDEPRLHMALPRNQCRTTHHRTTAHESTTQPRHRHHRRQKRSTARSHQRDRPHIAGRSTRLHTQDHEHPCHTRRSTDGHLPGDQTSTPTAESGPPSNIRPNLISPISNENDSSAGADAQRPSFPARLFRSSAMWPT